MILTGYSGFLGKVITAKYLQFYSSENFIKLGRGQSANVRWNFFDSAPELPKSEIIVHCMGLAHKKTSSKDNQEFFRINFEAKKNFVKR